MRGSKDIMQLNNLHDTESSDLTFGIYSYLFLISYNVKCFAPLWYYIVGYCNKFYL